MIKQKCFTKDWFQAMSKRYKYNDLGIIEKVIRAYSLLEMLARSGCPYIFKGGTCVGLLLGDNTRRLSIDIDIICPPGTDVEKYLKEISNYGFTRTELIERRQVGKNIPKSHSKFYYQIAYTDRTNRESFILLDVLYENTHYQQVNEIEIANNFIEMDGPSVRVRVPSIGDILGDKLTAFAPNTTGIPYWKNGDSKTTEIMKQAYDIGRLFDVVKDLSVTKRAFERISQIELGYRDLGTNTSIIFEDIRQTALLIATRGKEGKGNFEMLQDGIKRLQNFIYEEKYFIEDAITDTAKVAYIATCLENGVLEINKYNLATVATRLPIGKTFSSKLNKLKKTLPEAFFYWSLIDEMTT